MKIKAINDRPTIFIEGPVERDYFEAWMFADFMQTLNEAPEIDIRLDSPGGDPRIALAIVEMIKASDAKFSCYIDGWCASGATLIALACGKVLIHRQFGEFFIHEARALPEQWMTADEMEAAADFVRRYDEIMIEAYTNKTGKSREAIIELMKNQTWMTAQEAVEAGFADDYSDTALIDERSFNIAAYFRGTGKKETTDSPTEPITDTKCNTMSDTNIINKIKAAFGWTGSDDTDHVISARETAAELESLRDIKAQYTELKTSSDQKDTEIADLKAQVESYKTGEETNRETQIKADVAEAVKDFRIEASASEQWEANLKADYDANLKVLKSIPEGAVKPGKVQARGSRSGGKYGSINETTAKHLGE